MKLSRGELLIGVLSIMLAVVSMVKLPLMMHYLYQPDAPAGRSIPLPIVILLTVFGNAHWGDNFAPWKSLNIDVPLAIILFLSGVGTLGRRRWGRSLGGLYSVALLAIEALGFSGVTGSVVRSAIVIGAPAMIRVAASITGGVAYPLILLAFLVSSWSPGPAQFRKPMLAILVAFIVFAPVGAYLWMVTGRPSAAVNVPSAVRSTAPNDYLIVPGERIGSLRLGMQAADAVAALGSPSSSTRDGLRWFEGPEFTKAIAVQTTRTGQISWIGVLNNSRYTIRERVGPGSTEQSVRAAFGKPEFWMRTAGTAGSITTPLAF